MSELAPYIRDFKCIHCGELLQPFYGQTNDWTHVIPGQCRNPEPDSKDINNRIRAFEARVKELAEELTWAGGPSIRCETDGFDRSVPTIVHLGCAHLEIQGQKARAEKAEAEKCYDPEAHRQLMESRLDRQAALTRVAEEIVAREKAEAALAAIDGRAVHAAWRDGMIAQGRIVDRDRMVWDNLRAVDVALDEIIAQTLKRAAGRKASACKTCNGSGIVVSGSVERPNSILSRPCPTCSATKSAARDYPHLDWGQWRKKVRK